MSDNWMQRVFFVGGFVRVLPPGRNSCISQVFFVGRLIKGLWLGRGGGLWLRRDNWMSQVFLVGGCIRVVRSGRGRPSSSAIATHGDATNRLWMQLAVVGHYPCPQEGDYVG